MSCDIDATALIACVTEFYATNDTDRRKELDTYLCQFKSSFSCDRTVAVCILIMSPRNSPSVQYFGAISLYDTVRHRYEECIANITLMESLKKFLIDNLTTTAHVQMQSITNKLSATLALLVLYSIPDVWPQPVAYLTNIWAASPELLLRVLAEIAAEFSNIQMPLTQRSKLKTELHKISEDIICIISTVMGASDASPSTRQAAVECVEQWVQLPGAGLHLWTPVLSVVFGAVAEDSAALTNLLNILASNDELTSFDQLVLDICQYITTVVSQKVLSELGADGDSEEVVALVAAVCTMAVTAVPTLIQYAKSTLIIDLCAMFTSLSIWNGRYPIDETISDLPACFFTTLRENLLFRDMNNKADKSQSIISSIEPYYAEICRSATTKMSFPSSNEFETYDKEQREQFIAYRRARSEVSVDAFHIAGSKTLSFLNKELESAVCSSDLCRTECILYLWELVADYLTEANYPAICMNLELCSRFNDVGEGRDADRLANTLMRLLYALSHLIQDHDRAIQLESHAVRLILPYIGRPHVSEEALRTLEKYVSDRSETLLVIGDDISQQCYSFFMDESNEQRLRLTSLKCIGYILSMKSPSDVMEILNNVISPYVGDLAETDNINSDNFMEKRIFQISIFSSLFSSLHNKNASSSEYHVPSTLVILRRAFPMFRNILERQGGTMAIGDRVCDAIRSAVSSLPDAHLVEVFPFVSEILARAILTNPVAGCSLAKATVLVFGGVRPTAAPLCEAIRLWFSLFEENISSGSIEDWLGLIYQVVKKDWKTLRAHGSSSLPAINSAISIAAQTLVHSNEPCVVRLASQVLATISNQTTSFGDGAPRELLANIGRPLVKAIFERIHCELMRSTVEALADVLFFFIKQFPTETRSVINDLEHGDSPIVSAMFREVGNLRNFKQMTLRLNMAARKSSSVV